MENKNIILNRYRLEGFSFTSNNLNYQFLRGSEIHSGLKPYSYYQIFKTPQLSYAIRRHKIKTIAVRYGERSAAIAATIFSTAAVGFSPLPYLWGFVSEWFLPPVILTDIGLFVSSILLLKDYSRKNAKRTKNLTLIWFTTGLLAFILGKL